MASRGLLSSLLDLARAVVAAARTPAPAPDRAVDRARHRAPDRAPDRAPSRGRGPGRPRYAPRADGRPDPGEVVWAWVPFEEDASRGKDRPVLVLAVSDDERHVSALMLTSKDHDRDAADEARHGRHWMDVGAGGWDAQRRPSEVRLDRLLDLDASAVRREGAALDRAVFDRVVAAARRAQRGG